MAIISFMLGRRPFKLSADDVRDRLAHHDPDPIHQYSVQIEGVRWPVKQVMALATGLSNAEFQSQNSRRVLEKLGFTIVKVSTASPRIPSADVVLVGCVKSKHSHGALAKDLYASDYFSKMRAYAEATGRPWFIWGLKVAVQLEGAVGPLTGAVVDIHAGSAYVVAAETALRSRGVTVVDQLKGLTFGRRLSWYRTNTKSGAGALKVAAQLRDGSRSMTLVDFMVSEGAGFRLPGLYSWQVDETGAEDLTRGLGYDVAPGLIYAGLAGATRRGGSTSANTLWGRIATMHLGNRHEFSTLRYSLGSILASAHGLPTIDESLLTQWMYAHLRVIAVPVADADTLDGLESELLSELDPPLNLAKVAKTPMRARLSALRKQFGRAARA